MPAVYCTDSSNLKIINRVKMNTVLAGVDPAAVDHVCCRIMGLNPDDIEHITLAGQVGLGTTDPDSITVAGREVAVLASGEKMAGEYVATWDAGGNASGVYFCRLLADGRMAARKMLLVR